MPDPTNPELAATETPWMIRFEADRKISDLPIEAQGVFTDLLRNGQGVRDYYQAIPEDKFDTGIGEKGQGDSFRKQLLHEIGNTRLRAEALRTGEIKDWRYGATHPDELQALESMSRNDLLIQLDNSVAELYDAAKDPANLEKDVILPWNKKEKGMNSLIASRNHKILHLGIAIASADCTGGIPRPQSVKDVWG